MSIISKATEQHNELSKKLSGFCKEFKLYNLLGRFRAKKVRGISFKVVFDFILALVFSGKNLYNSESPSMSKDTVYRFLKATSINPRPLTNEFRMTAIVVDDSPYSRNRSKKVELLTKVYDHVSHRFFMGFQMLTLGFTDGVTVCVLLDNFFANLPPFLHASSQLTAKVE